MIRSKMKILALVCVAGLLAGCTAKVYTKDRARVDQKITGNAGCLYGTCPDRGEYSKTRQTFVLEIETRPGEVSQEDLYVSESRQPSLQEERYHEPARVQRPEPRQVVTQKPVPPVPVYVDYKVQEGDTLQKISKKFYDTYQRWYEIYEANRDVIANPDRIRPGITIRIPEK